MTVGSMDKGPEGKVPTAGVWTFLSRESLYRPGSGPSQSDSGLQ